MANANSKLSGHVLAFHAFLCMEKTCPEDRCANWDDFRNGERSSHASACRFICGNRKQPKHKMIKTLLHLHINLSIHIKRGQSYLKVLGSLVTDRCSDQSD